MDPPSDIDLSLGPPLAMESALRSHVHELMRGREEFRALMDKFKVSETLHAEKEEHSSRMLKEMQEELLVLRKQNEEYKMALMAQRSSKDLFMAKVKEIASTIELLHQREEATQARNAELKRDKERLASEIEELKRRLEDKEALTSQLAEIAKEREKNDAKTVDLMKREHKTELQSVQNSYEVSIKNVQEKMESEYVHKSDYAKLRETYELVLEDKKVLEESVQIVDHSLKESYQLVKDKEEEISALKNKCNTSEKNFLTASLRDERSERDAQDLREEINRAMKVAQVNEERILTLEREKSLLLTQVATLKFDASRTGAALAASRSRDEALQADNSRLEDDLATSKRQLSEIHGAILLEPLAHGSPARRPTPPPAAQGSALRTGDLL